MYEYSKFGQAIKRALSENDIYYCSIDDFCSGNIEELKKAVLFGCLEKYLPDIAYINGKELENFYNRYIKTLRLKVDNDGNFTVEICK